MFILRSISTDEKTGKNTEFNKILGDHYTVVQNDYDGWEEAIGEWIIVKKQIFSVVFPERGKGIPLFKNEQNLIMTSDGKIFSNMTWKNL